MIVRAKIWQKVGKFIGVAILSELFLVAWFSLIGKIHFGSGNTLIILNLIIDILPVIGLVYVLAKKKLSSEIKSALIIAPLQIGILLFYFCSAVAVSFLADLVPDRNTVIIFPLLNICFGFLILFYLFQKRSSKFYFPSVLVAYLILFALEFFN